MSAQHEHSALLLTDKQRTIVEAVNAARAVPEWQQIFTAERFETDMLDAIDARDVPKMVRVGLAFITRVGAEAVVERLDHLHDPQREGARIAAEHKKGRRAQELDDLERSTKAKRTKARQRDADHLEISRRHLSRLLKRRQP